MPNETEREPRPLHPDRRVRRGLATLRALEDRELEGDLDPRRLEDTEDSLDCRFTDNILALFAANELESLRRLGIELDGCVEQTAHARDLGLDDDFVAFGRLDDQTFVCTPREPEKDIADLFTFDHSDQTIQPSTVANLLEQCVERERNRLRDGTDDDAERADIEADELDVADVRLALYHPRNPDKKKVRHSKFGIGTVVDEHGSGESKKLEVEFDDQTRKILATYLEPL